MMRGIGLLIVAGLAFLPARSRAVTQDSFHATTTADLVDLCSPAASDPMRVAAIHFCQGYFVGAAQYHQVASAATGAKPIACLPNPPPSRDEIVSMFVQWARANPQYMGERPINSLFRFAKATWPCPP